MQTVSMSRHQLFAHMAPSVMLFNQPCAKDSQTQYRTNDQFSPFGSFLVDYDEEMEFFPPGVILNLYPIVLNKFPCLTHYINLIEQFESLTHDPEFWAQKQQNLQSFYRKYIII